MIIFAYPTGILPAPVHGCRRPSCPLPSCLLPWLRTAVFSPRSIPCIGPRGCAILGRKEPPHLPHLQPTVIVQLFNIFQHITSLVAPRKLQPAARVHIRCSTSLTHILRKACQKQKKNQARPLGRQPFYVIATANRAL